MIGEGIEIINLGGKMSNILNKFMTIKMPDGSTWAVPVRVIAEDRAKYYADEFDGSVEKSLEEDTAPLFEEDDYAIEDWAANNMDWSDVEEFAKELEEEKEVDFQEGWVNGDKEIIELP